MNMPVLPVTTHSSPPSADSTTRAADAGAPQDNAPAFSNVLSSQRGATANDETAAKTGRADASHTDTTKKQDPLGPDETLALILDSAALPLMQAPIQALAVPRHQTGAAALLKTDTAATDAKPASQRGQAVAALLTDDTAADDSPSSQQTAGDAASRNARLGAAQTILTPAAQASNPSIASATTATASSIGNRAATASRTATALAATAENAALPANPTTAAASAATAHLQTTPLSSPADTLAAVGGQASALGATLLPTAANPQATVQLAVPTPLSSPQWPQDFSRQILNLTQAGLAGHTVQMRVNPSELGPIHITLHLGDSLAQASFVSPHANVRQALENALPHLEQQLAQAGLSLGQANVSDQQAGQQQADQSAQGSSGTSDGMVFSLDGDMVAASSTTAHAQAPRTAARPDALVDTFV